MTRDNGIPLIFEQSTPGACAVSLPASDVPSLDPKAVIPPELLADAPPPLPEVGEPDLVRHSHALRTARSASMPTSTPSARAR